MTAFHEVRFPSDISRGATGGPGYDTSVLATVSGFERRNANWAEARGRWNVAHGLKRRDQVAALIAFFRARLGRAYGFRFKDWTDFQAIAQPIGPGDGAQTMFQLVKTYASGPAVKTRTISKPIAGSVAIHVDTQPQTSGWSLDPATGRIIFAAAPAAGAVITADFEFDVPVRFDTDQMDITIDNFAHGSWGQIPIVELRL